MGLVERRRLVDKYLKAVGKKREEQGRREYGRSNVIGKKEGR